MRRLIEMNEKCSNCKYRMHSDLDNGRDWCARYPDWYEILNIFSHWCGEWRVE